MYFWAKKVNIWWILPTKFKYIGQNMSILWSLCPKEKKIGGWSLFVDGNWAKRQEFCSKMPKNQILETIMICC